MIWIYIFLHKPVKFSNSHFKMSCFIPNRKPGYITLMLPM
uniref:Uncharacterized protein n=1 Tax=Lophocladia kuetzingii TaxID=675577 RepID=A0A1Z1MPL2_9FLOR|nr:hypothetical protein [Lophocladia kuetzingii]ARW67694.1 hypothetical protein [Lophocladia kuetzingii]